MAGTGRPSGRPAKPIEVKRALGNPGGRPLPEFPLPGEGLEAASSIPPAPALGPDGLDLWNQIWSAGKTWLSPTADLTLITMACQAFDEHEFLRRAISLNEVPRFYTTSNGQQVSHPFIGQLKETRTQLTSWFAALGFSPADRARLGLAEVRQNDPLDDLEKRRLMRVKAANE